MRLRDKEWWRQTALYGMTAALALEPVLVILLGWGAMIGAGVFGGLMLAIWFVEDLSNGIQGR